MPPTYQVIKKTCRVQIAGGDVVELPAGAIVKYVDDKWLSDWRDHPFHNLEKRSRLVIIYCRFGFAMVDPDDLEWEPIT